MGYGAPSFIYQEITEQAGHFKLIKDEGESSEFCKLINVLRAKLDLGEGIFRKRKGEKGISREKSSVKYMPEKNSRFREEGAMVRDGINLCDNVYREKQKRGTHRVFCKLIDAIRLLITFTKFDSEALFCVIQLISKLKLYIFKLLILVK